MYIKIKHTYELYENVYEMSIEKNRNSALTKINKCAVYYTAHHNYQMMEKLGNDAIMMD